MPLTILRGAHLCRSRNFVYGGVMSAAEAQQPGLRELKKRRTRAELSWATIRLVVEHGYDNVKVEDIAAAAGVSTRTFNNYFAGKGEAITARHVDRSLRIAEDLRARPADEPLWDAIRGAVRVAFTPGPEVFMPEGMDERRWEEGLARMMDHPAFRGEMIKAGIAAEREIAAAVAERTGTDVRTDLYPNLVASALSAATAATVQHRVNRQPPATLEDLLFEAIDLLTAGLPEPTR
jgi:AcrR family transcriptional regulator